jgi:hypothetical protein
MTHPMSRWSGRVRFAMVLAAVGLTWSCSTSTGSPPGGSAAPQPATYTPAAQGPVTATLNVSARQKSPSHALVSPVFDTVTSERLVVLVAGAATNGTGGGFAAARGCGYQYAPLTGSDRHGGAAQIWQATVDAAHTGCTITVTRRAGIGTGVIEVLGFQGRGEVGTSAAKSGPDGTPQLTLPPASGESRIYSVGIGRDRHAPRTSSGSARALQLFATAAGTLWLNQARPAGGTPSRVSLHVGGSRSGGWDIAAVEITPTLHNCAAAPSACGFPDSTNSGVPAGMTLTMVPKQATSGNGWSYDPRGWITVTKPGVTISRLALDGISLIVEASDVTIKDVDISNITGESSEGIAVGQVNQPANNTTIENTTITGLNTGSGRMIAGIVQQYQSAGLVARADDISRMATGIQVQEGSATLESNYIHDFGFATFADDGPDHLNGIASSNGGTQLTVADNTIIGPNGQTDAVALFCDSGTQKNALITDNLLDGGNYTIYGGDGGAECTGAATTNIRITNNRIGTTFARTGGHYGWLAYFSPGGTGNTVTGNRWDANGALIANAATATGPSE